MPLPLYGLDQHCHHARVAGRDLAHRFDVVEGDAHESRHQGLEARLHLAVAGGRQRRQRAAVERVLHHDDGRRLDAPAVPGQAGELDGGLVRLAAGVAEEHVVHAADGGEPVCEGLLRVIWYRFEVWHQAPQLLGQNPREPGVRVAERVDGDAGQRVQVAAAGLVPQPDAFAVRERQRQPAVSVHDVRHDGHSRVGKAEPERQAACFIRPKYQRWLSPPQQRIKIFNLPRILAQCDSRRHRRRRASGEGPQRLFLIRRQHPHAGQIAVVQDAVHFHALLRAQKPREVLDDPGGDGLAGHQHRDSGG